MFQAASTLTHAVVETLRISAPTVLEAMAGRARPREVYDGRLDSWSKRLLEHARVKVHAEGLENLGDGREVFVVMSNHQSVYDIPVLFQALPVPMRMVAKQELFRIPVWGKAMQHSGFVAIDRRDRGRAIASLAVAKKKMQDEGISIWIAPEGTRSRTGALGPFKSGGFHLALDAGLRILPVSIDGTFDLLRADTADVNKGGDVRVVVHAPVDPQPYGQARRSELMAAVRDVIAGPLTPRGLRGRARRPRRAPPPFDEHDSTNTMTLRTLFASALFALAGALPAACGGSSAGSSCEAAQDCQAGLVCDGGRCAACESTELCNTQGLCKGSGGACVATDEACRKLATCASGGTCRAVDGVCQAAADEDCAKSAECQKAGRCGAVEGQCRPKADAHCRASEQCKALGWCSIKDGFCAAATDADCASTDSCPALGSCTAREGTCVIGTDADCKRARLCKALGSCTLVDGECHLTKAEDCRLTEQCEKEGACSFDGTTCVVAKDADCKGSVACKGEGRCKAKTAKAGEGQGSCVKRLKRFFARRRPSRYDGPKLVTSLGDGVKA